MTKTKNIQRIEHEIAYDFGTGIDFGSADPESSIDNYVDMLGDAILAAFPQVTVSVWVGDGNQESRTRVYYDDDTMESDYDDDGVIGAIETIAEDLYIEGEWYVDANEDEEDEEDEDSGAPAAQHLSKHSQTTSDMQTNIARHQAARAEAIATNLPPARIMPSHQAARAEAIVKQAQQKVQAIIERVERDIASYTTIQQECLTAVFFAFPTITPKLLAVLDRYWIKSHDFIDRPALPELRALMTEFNVNNCKLS